MSSASPVLSETTRLALPLIAAAQAQKHVTHNEALGLVDALVHLAVKDRGLAGPPPDAETGDRHIVGAAPTGAWAGHAGEVAEREEGHWRFLSPRAGWLAWVEGERCLIVHDGEAWGDAEIRGTSRLGINATADAVNRLALASAASLFTHAGGDHRMTINRASAADTASQVFSTGFSARAEIGLAGSDDLAVKVSGDGTTFRTALRAETSGLVRRPHNPCAARAMTGALSAALTPAVWVPITGTETVWSEGLGHEAAPFDVVTGRFAVAEAGPYRIEAAATFYAATEAAGVYLSLWRSGALLAGSQQVTTLAAAPGFASVQTSVLAALEAGDDVEVRAYVSAPGVSLLNSGFGAFSLAFAG
ncbi:MAG: DUF2793 domain-containing protein [Phreatobacter sp.]|uniref:DUF2793 domain-containing protein n=1 Tax=Phreatobacter sp. TaxID=1966341 RepID=UPI00273585A1|nr:DUF2793 domain-containing protein [Phreatobacter sp.]MDP2801166.1 DUF2793 domain-containing protein [Phreatobacter sp.]